MGQQTQTKMAALAKIVRTGSCLARGVSGARTITVSSFQGVKYTMNDPIDHATGVEKYELLSEEQGNDDPFFCKMGMRGEGTKENPNIIKAMSDYRMVGCVCEPDDTNIKFMWLYEGKPKRCKCDTGSSSSRCLLPLRPSCLCKRAHPEHEHQKPSIFIKLTSIQRFVGWGALFPALRSTGHDAICFIYVMASQ